VKEFRELYFTLIDLVVSEGETGYKKKEIHKILKEEVLSMLAFETTKKLDLANWAIYINFVKDYIRENFNFYI
jgi:hypothetical protein